MATLKQKKAIEKITENHGNLYRGMIAAGYSENTAKKPQNLTESKAWMELMEDFLSDAELSKKHAELLNATGIGHMVFPTTATDEDITKLLQEANCIVKRFMHSETQTHAWYFAPDNKARKDALDMAYKLKGRYEEKSEKNKPVTINILNYYGEGNNNSVSVPAQTIPTALSGSDGQGNETSSSGVASEKR